MVKGKFTALNTLERSQINDLRCYLNKLEKVEKNKVKAGRRNDIIEVRTEIKEFETEKKSELKTGSLKISIYLTNL